jgi:uncharacterized repeat protein (TIGR02543 family)
MKKCFITFLVLFILAQVFTFFSCEDDVKPEQSVIKYHVVFDTNGGSAVEEQEVESGKTVTKPEDPEKTTGDAMCFAGWYSDVNLTEVFDFSTVITKNTVLYARWTEIPLGSYLVTFESLCDTKIDNQIVKDGEKAEEPEALTKDGYAFSHWYLTEDTDEKEFNFDSTPITKETSLKAKWNESGIYEASFEDDGFFVINLYENIESESEAW